MSRIRVSVRELRLGMYVVELDRDWEDTPFLFQGFKISSKADIEAVGEYCKHVVIDTTLGIALKSKRRPTSKPIAPEKKSGLFGFFRRSEPPPQIEVEKAIEPAKASYKKASRLTRSFMDDIRLGIGFKAENIKKQVSDCVDNILRNSDAMMWLTQMKEHDDVIAAHSLNTCILSISFGKFLGLPRPELENLGLCALLHDVGLLKIPNHILNKKTALTANEVKTFQTHTELGRNILMSASDVYFGVIDVAYTHHEHINGTGYPRGLAANQISPFTRIVSLCDSYDSMINAMPFEQEKTPFGALKVLNNEKNKRLDGQLVDKYIDFIGVFPIGSIVELNSGEIGIVISSQRKAPNQPKVLILLNKEKQPIKEKVANLLILNKNRQQTLKIVRVLKAGDYQIDLGELQQKGLKLEFN